MAKDGAKSMFIHVGKLTQDPRQTTNHEVLSAAALLRSGYSIAALGWVALCIGALVVFIARRG